MPIIVPLMLSTCAVRRGNSLCLLFHFVQQGGYLRVLGCTNSVVEVFSAEIEVGMCTAVSFEPSQVVYMSSSYSFSRPFLLLDAQDCEFDSFPDRKTKGHVSDYHYSIVYII